MRVQWSKRASSNSSNFVVFDLKRTTFQIWTIDKLIRSSRRSFWLKCDSKHKHQWKFESQARQRKKIISQFWWFWRYSTIDHSNHIQTQRSWDRSCIIATFLSISWHLRARDQRERRLIIECAQEQKNECLKQLLDRHIESEILSSRCHLETIYIEFSNDLSKFSSLLWRIASLSWLLFETSE